MAHELEMIDGKASMFSVTETPWHKEGVVLAAAPTFDEALAIGNLDFVVEKCPTFREITVGTNTDGEPIKDFVQNAGAFVTVRQDTGKELGTVGAQYKVLSNYDAFRAMIPLVDSGVLKLETGGVLRDGADVWMLGKFDAEQFGPAVQEVFGDEVIPYALFTNNHDGRRNATIAETPIRVVCANTLGFAEHEMERSGKYIGVRHTGDAGTRMVEAAENLFKGIVMRYETIAEQYRVLKAVHLTDEDFRNLVLNVAVPDPREQKRFNPEAKLAELVVDRYEEKTKEITRLWTEGKGHSGDKSAWEAYNGLVEALDHNAELFPTRDGSYRTASLMGGRIGRSKTAVLNELVTFSQFENA